GSRPRVLRRIGLKNQAGRTKRLFGAEVGQPHTRRRNKILPIGHDGMHLLVACNGPNTIFFEPYNRSGVPKLYVIRIRIRQELFAERIDVQARNCVFLSIVLSELHSVLLSQPACATGTSATET